MFIDTLPNKPSELIRLALKDLSKIEKNTDYKVDMHQWHEKIESKCLVCLAGSVMANTLKVDKNFTITNLYDDSRDKKLLDKFIAINLIRVGNIIGAINKLGMIETWSLMNVKEKYIDYSITPYDKNSVKFKSDLMLLADELELLGY